jgi:RNA polymerase sigma-70 factor (ECF subfamily)
MDHALVFDRIVAEHEGRIVRYLSSLLGDAAAARDLTQETFLRVHKGLEQLRSQETRTAWIYRIASNLALDRLRGRTSRQEGQTVSLEVELLNGKGVGPAISDEELSAEGRLEQEEMAECLRRHIDCLPVAYRACLILRDLEGLEERTVAEILDCSVGVVKVRTHRARKKLREALREGCSFYRDERGVFRCEPSDAREEGRG